MAVKPTKPIFPTGLESEDQIVTHAGILNDGVIEHGADAVLTLPETTDDKGTPSAVRYNAETDEYEGYFAVGGWSSLGGGDGRWEVLPYAASSNLVEGRSYLINNSKGVSTVLLPIPTKIGDSVTVSDSYGMFAQFPLTINPQNKPLYGVISPMTISTANVAVTFTWAGDDRGWIITGGVGLGQGRIYSREIFTKTVDSDTVVVTLGNEPDIVDVYIGGKRLSESKFDLTGSTLTFSPAIPAGSDIQVVEYTPVQLSIGGGTGSDIDDGANPAWLYIATGGEKRITPGTTLKSVSCIYLNGDRQFPGRGFEFSQTGNYIDVADTLEAGDEVIIVSDETGATINSVLISDPTVIARNLNVKTEHVKILAQNQDISSSFVVYDQVTQTAWMTGLAQGVVLSWESTGESLTLTTDQGVYTLQRFGVDTTAGDYEKGPFTLVDRNQHIRYQKKKYYLTSDAVLPLTMSGNTDSSWVVDSVNFLAVGDTTLRKDLLTVTGAEIVKLPYGSVRNAVMYYTPEMFTADVAGTTDWSTPINTAILQARNDGVATVRGDKIYNISSSVLIDNFSTGFKLDLGGLSATTDWTNYSDWKNAFPLVSVGTKSNGSQVGLSVRLGFAYGRDQATCFQLSGYGAGGSNFHCDRMRNCVIGYQCDSSTLSGSASNRITGGYWYNGKCGIRIKRGNATFIAEGHKVCVGFITNMAYGGIQLFNGSQYFQIYGTDADFNGKYLAELKVDQAPASDIRGTNVTWNGVSYEVIDYYQLTRGNYYILVIDSQETTGGKSTINTATSTALSDGTTNYVISSVRTPTSSQFYFDFIHGFEGSPFGKGDANFGYLGGKVGGLQRSSNIKWHNSFDENSNELNGLWVRNQSSSMSFYDKWSGLVLGSWTTTGTTATFTLPGQLNVSGPLVPNKLFMGNNRSYGTEVNVNLAKGTSATIRTFSYVGDGTVTTTKEVWNVTIAGPNGLDGIGGTFQIHVGSSGIELKNTSGISYPTLSVNGYSLVAAQSAQTTMNLTFMFERKL